MLPVAFGAYGQPPRPPTDASKTDAPASYAASAFAYPVLRVLCRCTPTSPLRIDTRSTRRLTWVGVALERAAECAGDDRRGRKLGCGEDRLHLGSRLGERHPAVAAVEGLRCRQSAVHAIESGGTQSFESLLIEDEPRVRRTG